MLSHSPFKIILKPRRVSFSGTYWPGIPVNCRYRGLAKSNVSAAVERLRARGVLTVSPAPDNRRQRLLGFAPDALPMVAVLADIQRCSLEPLFAGFTAQEQQTLQDYLRRMDANLLRELNKE